MKPGVELAEARFPRLVKSFTMRFRKRCRRVADHDDACQRPVCGHESA